MSQVALKRICMLVTDPGPEEERTSVALEHVVGGAGMIDPGAELPRRRPAAGLAAVKPGDVLFGKLRPYLAKTLQVRERMFASTELLALRPKLGVDSRWLHYLVMSDQIVRWAVATSDGSKMPRTNWSALGEYRVMVPEPSTQRAIADFLDTETARIDALIAKKQRMIGLLEKRWRSAVEYRMVQLTADHGSIPLKRLVRCLDGRRIPLSGEERTERQGIYPYYGASGAIDQVNDYLFDEELVLLGEDGAQLADPDYEISFVVRGKYWVNNHAHVLRPVGADADFLALHLSTFDRFAFISGATREKITQEDMWRIMVPAIDLGMQRSEAHRLLSLKRKARKLGNLLLNQNSLLVEHRQALITAAVTGEIEVSGTMIPQQ